MCCAYAYTFRGSIVSELRVVQGHLTIIENKRKKITVFVDHKAERISLKCKQESEHFFKNELQNYVITYITA